MALAQQKPDPIARRDPAAVNAVIAVLAAKFGNRLVTSQAVREQHANTTTWIANEPPDAVIFPQAAPDVQDIVRICAERRVPVIPFGTGTSLEGHVNAPYGGVSIDFRDMKRVLAVNSQDLDCVVEPGITRKELNEHLRDQGLFFPIDPGADASIGGMAATRCSGTNAVRYGTMKDNVLALKVVLANGELMTTARRAKKSSAGYDLTRLIVGAEGTLGVITELTLKLSGIPEAISSGVCPFPSLEAACNAAIATIQFGVPVARIELLDETQMEGVNRYSKTSYTVAPTLFFEFHSDSDRHVADQAATVEAIATEHGGHRFEWATRLEDRERLWQARHDALYAALALRPGGRPWTTDVCVPISRLAECILETKQDNRDASFPIALVGHAGDGNFHLVYVLDPDNPAELDQARRLNDRMVMRALAMGGTCSGEHGVGYGKMKYLDAEHGPALDVMRTIKRALDPDDRMNPGKMVKPD